MPLVALHGIKGFLPRNPVLLEASTRLPDRSLDTAKNTSYLSKVARRKKMTAERQSSQYDRSLLRLQASRTGFGESVAA
jgi:hypothetical protein